jgi:hypothetical protein
MGIHETKIPEHWNYFLALEDDVMRLSRFVELTDDNSTAYSLEMARLLLVAASEVDVVAKQICRKLDAKSKAKQIDEYRTEITAAYPDIAGALVHIPKFGLTLNPWEQWAEEGKNPIWWTANNKVKHHRHTNFSDANLKNSLNAVAGLFLLLLYFYADEAQKAQLSPDPRLFRAGTPFYTAFPAWGPHVTIYTRDQLGTAWESMQSR